MHRPADTLPDISNKLESLLDLHLIYLFIIY